MRASAGAPAHSGPGQAADLFDILRRRRRFIGFAGMVAVIVAGAAGLVLPRSYLAVARVVIEPQSPAQGAPPQSTERADDLTIETNVAAMSSRATLDHVLDALSDDPGFVARAFPISGRMKAALESLQAKFAEVAPPWLLDAADKVSATLRSDSSRRRASPEEIERATRLDEIERNLKVNSEPRSRVVTLRYASSEADIGARVINEVIRTFIHDQEERQLGRVKREFDWLSGHIPALKQDLDQALTAAGSYRIENAVGEAAAGNAGGPQMVAIRNQLDAARAAIAAHAAALDIVRALVDRPLSSFSEVPDATRLNALQRREQDLLLKPQAWGESARNEAVDVRQAIAAEAGRLIAQYETEDGVLRARARALEDRLRPLQAASVRASQFEAELNEMDRKANAIRQVYESLLQRRQFLFEQRDKVEPGVRILTPATPPLHPSSPHPVYLLPPTLIICFVGSGFLAVLTDRRDRSLRSSQDVADHLGIPCAGLLPKRSGTRGPAEWGDARLGIAPSHPCASMQGIMLDMLRLEAGRQSPRIIAVTSSLPGDGARAVASGFAACIATVRAPVLLIDFDAGRAAPSKLRSGAEEPGALDVLRGSCTSKAAIQSLPHLPFDYLPLGSRAQRAFALLAGDGFSRMLRDLAETYDSLVIDCGAVLAGPEARAVAAQADRILFAVRWGVTRRDIAERALGRLETQEFLPMNYPRVSAVITQVDARRQALYNRSDALELTNTIIMASASK